MEQHQQGTPAHGMTGRLLVDGGNPEHFASPLSPILPLEDSFDNIAPQGSEQPGSANVVVITKQANALAPSQIIQSPEADVHAAVRKSQIVVYIYTIVEWH